LLEDQENERREPGLASPERGQPVAVDDRREVGIGGAELGDRRLERGLVEHAANATRRGALSSRTMTRERSRISTATGLLALGLLLLPR